MNNIHIVIFKLSMCQSSDITYVKISVFLLCSFLAYVSRVHSSKQHVCQWQTRALHPTVCMWTFTKKTTRMLEKFIYLDVHNKFIITGINATLVSDSCMKRHDVGKNPLVPPSKILRISPQAYLFRYEYVCPVFNVTFYLNNHVTSSSQFIIF